MLSFLNILKHFIVPLQLCYPFASLESQWNHSSVPVHWLWCLLVDSQATSICVQTLEIEPFILLLHGRFQRFSSSLSPQLSHHSLCLHSFPGYGYLPSTYLFLLISPLSNPLLQEYISKAQTFLFRVGWYWISSYLDGPFRLMAEIGKRWPSHEKRQTQLLHFHVQVLTFCLCIILTFIVKHSSY